MACERIVGDDSGSKPSTSQFGLLLGEFARAMTIAFKCLHPGTDRATLKHSASINDLLSSRMVAEMAGYVAPTD
jgi:hypothetical protein